MSVRDRTATGRIPGAVRGKTSQLALFSVGLAISALFAFLAIRGVKWSAVADAYADSEVWWIVPALAVFAVAVVVRIERWRQLFPAERRPPFGITAEALLIGMCLNNVLPFRAGDGARIVVMRARGGYAVSEVTATVVVERLWDVLGLLILLFVLAPWFPPVSWLHAAAILSAVIAAGLATAIFVLRMFGSRPLRFALAPLHRLGPFSRERVAAAADGVLSGLATVRGLRPALVALGLTIASWIVTALSFWVLMQAFGLDVGLLAAVLVLIAVGLGMILPSSPAALGVFEAATVLALKPYGLTRTEALPYALALHALNAVPFIVAGAIALHHIGRDALAAWRDHGAVPQANRDAAAPIERRQVW